MSFIDIVIIAVVVLLVGGIGYRLYKKKDESYCASCSYKKSPETKEIFKK